MNQVHRNAVIDWRNANVIQQIKDLAHSDIVCAGSGFAEHLEWEKRQSEGGIQMPWSAFESRFELKPATLTMLVGYSGHFKSTITAQMILSAMQQGKRVALASLELTKPEIMLSLMDIASTTNNPSVEWKQEFFKWCEGKLIIYDRVDAIEPEDALSFVAVAHDTYKCDLIILDALMMCGLEGEDRGAEKDFSQQIQALCKSQETAIVLVHHCRKPNGVRGQMTVPDKYDAMGSSNLANICQNVLIVWHDKDKAHKMNEGIDFDDSEPDLIVLVDKHRGGKFEGRVPLWQHKTCRGFCQSSRRLLRPIL